MEVKQKFVIVLLSNFIALSIIFATFVHANDIFGSTLTDNDDGLLPGTDVLEASFFIGPVNATFTMRLNGPVDVWQSTPDTGFTQIFVSLDGIASEDNRSGPEGTSDFQFVHNVPDGKFIWQSHNRGPFEVDVASYFSINGDTYSLVFPTSIFSAHTLQAGDLISCGLVTTSAQSPITYEQAAITGNFEMGREIFVVGQPFVYGGPDVIAPIPPVDSFLQHGGNQNFNEGANSVLVVEKKGTKRVVVGFDLPTITNQVVNSARLVFTLERPTQNWESEGGTLDAHRLIEPFTEGNGFVWGQEMGLGDRGTGSGVTWNCATDANISDKKFGCDARWKGGSQAIESVTDRAAITNGQMREVSWDVTVDVQAALTEQATDIRWLIRKTLEHRKGQAVFYSKEGAAELGDMLKAPRLELDYVD